MSDPNDGNAADPGAAGAPPGGEGAGSAPAEEKIGGEPLSTDEYMKVYLAVLLGEPDPIGTESSAKAHEELSAEIAASPDAQWDIPGEIPNIDPQEPEPEDSDPEPEPNAEGAVEADGEDETEDEPE